MVDSILEFWFTELKPAQWWQKNKALDKKIARRFGELHQQARAGELYAWRATAEGRLGEIIVLDQFSRNIYRDQPQAFASDGMALVLAQEAIRTGADQELSPQQRVFLYMPFMHSESIKIHEVAQVLFTQNADPSQTSQSNESESTSELVGAKSSLKYQTAHRDIIQRFGRYPHRNAILGRESSAEEQAFLKQPNSSF
ncbi:DUF924 family protein [Oceanisphaera sp. W20_SRM_FM3]|uniref:DUF924 family protein n=1 Tax=Oceanisphaera sp. W20_SRM_FM3 TaxID=3240267 RepID=UPI003F9B402D